MSRQGVIVKRDDSVFWRGERIGFIRRRNVASKMIEYKFFPADYGEVLRELTRKELVKKIRRIYRAREIEQENIEKAQTEGVEA